MSTRDTSPGPSDPDDQRQHFARGLPDHHNPLGGVGGAPPARSALTFRLVLACCGLLLSVFGAVLLWLASVPIGFVVLLGLIAVTAAIDIVVILRRKRRGEPG